MPTRPGMPSQDREPVAKEADRLLARFEAWRAEHPKLSGLTLDEWWSRRVELGLVLHGDPDFDQTDYRIRVDDTAGLNAAFGAGDGALNTQTTVYRDQVFRVRIAVDETAGNAQNNSFSIEYRINTGGGFGSWTAISGTTPIQWATSGQYADGDATTQVITTGGTFAAGDGNEADATSGNWNNASSTGEWEWCLTMDSAQVAQNDVIEVRQIWNGTVGTFTYTVSGASILAGIIAPTFTPEQVNWRWSDDDLATPSSWMAAENTKPTLPGSSNYTIRHLRVEIEETGGAGDTNKAVKLQVTEDGTNWQDVWADTNNDEHMYLANGAGTAGGTIASRVLTGTDTSGKYHEDQTTTETLNANEHLELDFAVYMRVVLPDTDYSFRLVWDGTTVPVKSGSSTIQLRGSTAASREVDSTPNSIAPWTDSGDPDPKALVGGHRRLGFYDGARWWAFFVSTTNTVQYHSTTDLASWSTSATTGLTGISGYDNIGVAFKDVGGTKYVILASHSGSTTWYFKRGTISGSTITWDSTVRSFTPPGSQANGAPNLVIDSSDFLWFGGKDITGGQVWAARSVNAVSNATYYTFNTTKTLSETLTGGNANANGDSMEMVDIGSQEVLCVWWQNSSSDIRAAKVSESGGFGTAATASQTANSHSNDWGVSRSDGTNVYLVHGDATTAAHSWALAVYSISGDSWASGTSPSVTKSGSDATANDGLVVHAGGDGNIYAAGTFAPTQRDTRIKYKAYTGGTSGTWDGSLSDLTQPTTTFIGNADSISLLEGDDSFVCLFERGDDNLSTTYFVIEYYHTSTAGTTTVQRTFAGSISTLTGALDKQAQVTFEGSGTPAGSILKEARVTFEGSVSSLIGLLLKQAQVTFEGLVSTLVGTLANSKLKLLSVAGVIATLTGTLIKQAETTFEGGNTPTGSLVKQAQVTFEGSGTPTGALTTTKLLMLSVAGTISTLTGALLKQAQKQLAGSIASSGVTTKEASVTFEGSGTTAGALTKQASVTFEGSISTLTGALSNIKLKLLSVAGSISTITGLLTKQVVVTFEGSGTPTGSLTKQAQKLFAGTISTITGALSSIKIKLLSVAGSISTLIGSLTKQVDKSMSGATTSAGSLVKEAQATFEGGTTPVGVLTTIKMKVLSVAGTIASAGALVKSVTQTNQGTVSTSGALVKTAAMSMSGAISSAGAIIKQAGKVVVGTLASAGSLATQKIVGGTVETLSRISRRGRRDKTYQSKTNLQFKGRKDDEF